jgi:hypothetical protein
MNLFKNKTQSRDPKHDHLAQIIAGQIISWQTQASKRVNHWINGYSRKRQGLILILFGVLATCALIASLTPYAWQVPLHHKGTYLPQHIGEPSERIMPKPPINTATDSITNNK